MSQHAVAPQADRPAVTGVAAQDRGGQRGERGVDPHRRPDADHEPQPAEAQEVADEPAESALAVALPCWFSRHLLREQPQDDVCRLAHTFYPGEEYAAPLRARPRFS